MKADRFLLWLIYDEAYIPFLLRYCKVHHITLLVSLFDVDLMVLAKNRELFAHEGITVMVSEPDVVDICNDKWKTYEFCIQNGFDTPKTFRNLESVIEALHSKMIHFPVMIKPRWGMGSIAVSEACSEEELVVLSAKVKREIFASYLQYESALDENACVLYQEKLHGEEYGLDVVHDFNKMHMLTVVRRKIAMRSGETDCAMVVQNPQIESLGTRVGAALSHIGNLDMDVFLVEDVPYVLELNARFGGGYPFSHFAGVNLPGAIVKWMKGEPLDGELVVKEYNRLVQKDIRLIDITE